MKKFLTKKATMIGSIVAAAVVFVLLLAFCVRPVSVGYSYKLTKEREIAGKKVETTIVYHFNSFDKVTMTMQQGDEEESYKYWYFVKDGVLELVGLAEDYKVNGVVVGEAMSKEDFKKEKEATLKDWDKKQARENGTRIDAFKVYGVDDGKVSEDKAVNGGAIATVVVLAVVDAVLVAGAVASVLLRKKK